MSQIFFHPPVIHFPIAFYFLELGLLSFSAARKRADFFAFARLIFKAGYVLMIMAMITGLYDAGGLAQIKGGVRPHFMGAVSIFILYTYRCWLYRKTKAGQDKTALLIATGILGCILVALTGYFGGILVYA